MSGGLLTTLEFAREIPCSRRCVSSWVERGLLTPVKKRGRLSLFSPSDLPRLRDYYSGPGKNDSPTSGDDDREVQERDPLPEVPDPPPAALLSEAAPPTGGDRYWRRVKPDPEIKPETISFGPIRLPVVRDNTPDGARKVPDVDAGFMLDPGEAVVLANMLRNAEPTWLWGPSGAGKTSGIKQMCATLNWPLYRVQMTADFAVADFVGVTQVTIDEKTGQAVTTFRDGLLIQAMLNGGVLLVDEVSVAPPGVLMALQAVLERSGGDVDSVWRDGGSWCSYINTENGGEVIHAHPRFRIAVTDNTNGQGDATGAYSGTNVMNEAFRSRFTQWLRKDYPAQSVWIKILTNKVRGLSKNDATRIVQVALDVNEGSALLGSKKVTNEAVINPRDTLAVARLFMVFGDLSIAFKVGVLDSMQGDSPDRQFIADLVRNREGGATYTP